VSAEPVRAKPRGLTRLAVRNGAVAFFTRISGLLSGMVLTPIVLGALGRDLYGVVTVTGSTFDYLTLLRGGLGEATRRHVTLHAHSAHPEKARAYYAAGFWWGLVLRLGLLAAGLALAAPLAAMLKVAPELRPDAVLGISLIFVAAVLTDTSSVLEVPVYATGKISTISIARGILTWLRVGAVIAGLTFVSKTLPVYGTALIVTSSIALGLFIALASRTRLVGAAIPRPYFGDAKLRKEIFTYGGLFLVVQTSSLLYLSADNLLIGAIYGPGAVTAYSFGVRWAPIVGGFVHSLVGPIAPLFTQLEAHGQEDRTRAAILRAVTITSALAVPACLVPCVVGDLFLMHWVGEEYQSSARYMWVMLGAATIETAFSPVWAAMMGRGRVGWIAGGDLLVAVGNVIFSLILGVVLGFGLLGFALGNALALLAKNLLLRPMVARRETALPPASQFMRPLVRALAGGAPGLLLLFFTRPYYSGSLLTVVLAALAGGVLVLFGSAWASIGRQGFRTLRAEAGR